MIRNLLFTFLLIAVSVNECFSQEYGWTKLTSPTNSNLKRIHISGSEAWLLDDTIIYHSGNYPSEQFSPQFTGTNFNDLFLLNQSGNNYCWAVGYSSLGAMTTDTAGHTWITMSLGGTSTYNCVSFPTTSLGFASGTDKRLHKTVNGGANWTDTGVILGFSTVTALFFVDSNTGYAGTGDPRLAKTTDGGATWIDEGDIIGTVNDIYFFDSAHGWVVGADDILYYDNGIWTHISNTTGYALNSVFFINANEGWVAGNGGTLLHSTDGGASWNVQSSGTSANLLDIFFTSPIDGYAVGTSGTILHYTQLTSVEEHSNLPTIFSLGQNQPNPFNPTTKIEYSISVPGHVTLSVYNILGQKVAELVDETQLAGKFSADFNGADIPSGIYYYRLQFGNKNETRKMMLIK